MTHREHLRWLKRARDLLVEACGNQLGDVIVIVHYGISGNGIEFKLPCNRDAPEWPEQIVGVPETELPLRTPHRRLLEVCTAQPQSAKRLASLAGYSRLNSYVRAALADLVRLGQLVHSPDGYRLAA